MTFPFFKGTGVRRDEPAQLPPSRRSQFFRPEFFRADPKLVDAVNVALLLGQPLLLTGEPGTGKTQLGRHIAWELGLGEALKFDTKSTSTAGSLFYQYDALKRFQRAQSGVKEDGALPYITYQALGAAILFTREPTDVAPWMPAGMLHPGRRRSLVIIDEIDKAPRDFPNDILNELDQLYFRIPELDNVEIRADDALRPIIVITSNSEKDLPDAFLRRCVFYHIPFPTQQHMRTIVENRLGIVAGGANPFLTDALDLFYRLRDASPPLRKKPSTAELLEWISATMDTSGDVENPFRAERSVALRTLSALAKTVDDQAKARQVLEEWLTDR